MGMDGGHALSASSLRAQRSNPESLRGKALDCFAALAMTECEASASSSKYHCHSPRKRGIQYAAASRLNHSRLWNAGSPGQAGRRQRVLQTRLRILAAHLARALPDLSTLEAKRAQGRPGADLAPAVRCAKMVRKETAQQHTGGAKHSAFPAQWLDGLCRALPGAEFPLASLAPAKVTSTAPVDATAASAKHLTVATTVRTTRFCRTHGSPFRRSFSSPVDGAGNLQTRRT